MAPYIHCKEITKSFGSKELFKRLSLSLFQNDQIGLIGPNGSGKSTLLKILASEETPDSGEVSSVRGLKIGYVPQTASFPDITPKEVLLRALETHELLEGYEKEVLAETWLSKMDFKDTTTLASKLSGGWKKRLSLAKELMRAPDLLLLDEPTNHLDLEGILWLEKFLVKEAKTYLLVTHDRYFLQKVAGKIIEINQTYPNGLFAVDGDYGKFLEQKEAFLQGQLETERSLATKARRETEWLRQTPKARTTKSKSRIEEAENLFETLSEVKQRNIQKKAKIAFVSAERETKKLLVAKNLKKNMGTKVLFENLDVTLSPGTRMGLMGLNGTGKTTLLRLLAEEIQPDEGTIKKAENLNIVYFDQHRAHLPDHLTLRDALSPTGDYVTYHGKPIHVNGWCRRFLFSPDLLELPIKKLSGGERARITIARLMLEPADLLLLDEPTNDLDIPTLEILEESLMQFPGAVVLITHDRFMLDRICNRFLALGELKDNQQYASYLQWEQAMEKQQSESKPKEKKPQKPKERKSTLTQEERKELRGMEKSIAKVEKTIAQLGQKLEEPKIAEDPAKLQEVCTEIALHEATLEKLYLRWQELEEKI